MPTEHEQELMALRQQIHDLEEQLDEPCEDCPLHESTIGELEERIEEKDKEIERLRNIIKDAYNDM